MMHQLHQSTMGHMCRRGMTEQNGLTIRMRKMIFRKGKIEDMDLVAKTRAHPTRYETPRGQDSVTALWMKNNTPWRQGFHGNSQTH